MSSSNDKRAKMSSQENYEVIAELGDWSLPTLVVAVTADPAMWGPDADVGLTDQDIAGMADAVVQVAEAWGYNAEVVLVPSVQELVACNSPRAAEILSMAWERFFNEE